MSKPGTQAPVWLVGKAYRWTTNEQQQLSLVRDLEAEQRRREAIHLVDEMIRNNNPGGSSE